MKKRKENEMGKRKKIQEIPVEKQPEKIEEEAVMPAILASISSRLGDPTARKPRRRFSEEERLAQLALADQKIRLKKAERELKVGANAALIAAILGKPNDLNDEWRSRVVVAAIEYLAVVTDIDKFKARIKELGG